MITNMAANIYGETKAAGNMNCVKNQIILDVFYGLAELIYQIALNGR